MSRCGQGPEEDVGSHRVGATGSCKPPGLCVENMGSLQEQQVL